MINLIYKIRNKKIENKKINIMNNEKLDDKALYMLLYFISIDNSTTSKTGLMKYLFYSDFTYYRDYGKTISKENYIRYPNGACPENWSKYLNKIVSEGLAEKKEIQFSKNVKGDFYALKKQIDFNQYLTDKEIERLNQVYSALPHKTKELCDFNHKEAAWLCVDKLNQIPLEMAYHIDLLEDYEGEDEDQNEYDIDDFPF